MSPDSGTRGHHLKLIAPPFRLDVGKFCFISRVVKIWNALPERIISASSLQKLKKELNITVTNENFFLSSFLIGTKLR